MTKLKVTNLEKLEKSIRNDFPKLDFVNEDTGEVYVLKFHPESDKFSVTYSEPFQKSKTFTGSKDFKFIISELELHYNEGQEGYYNNYISNNSANLNS